MEFRKQPNDTWIGYLNRKKYLHAMLGRLHNEVEVALKAYVEYSSLDENPMVGVFGLVRLMMPVVEALGKVIYPNQHKSAVKVLTLLNVPYPNLCWKAFRDALLHNDEMTPLLYIDEKISIGWQLGYGHGHDAQGLMVCLDLQKLYEDLEKLIESEYERDDGIAEVQFFNYHFTNSEKDPDIVSELKQISGEYKKHILPD